MNENKKKNVLIIGGSSSLGLEIVNKFISNDWNVIATYNLNKLSMQKNLTIQKLNLLSLKSINTFINFLKTSSKIDCMIFLPSIINGKKLQEYSFKEVNDCLSINFNSQAYLFGKILFCFSKKGSILFISSISGERGSYDPIYAASKGAQISFVKSISKSLAPDLRVNILSPSLIKDSNMYLKMEKSIRKRHLLTNPMKTLMLKEDFAQIVYNISSKHWKHLNGQVISLNGGLYS